MILVVSELYYPEETSTGYILTKIAEGLAENFSVSVLTGPPDYSGLKEAPKAEVRNKVKIVRVSTPNLSKDKILSRLIRSIFLSLKLAAKTIMMTKKGDTVFVVTNPAPLLILMSLICRLKRTSLVILIHDVFPENLHAAQLLKNDTILYKFFVRLFNAVYRASDHVVVIGRDMEKIMKAKIKTNHPEISIVPNWADTADIHPGDRSSNPILKKLNIENKFVVQFAGNIGRVQGIEQMVSVAEMLKDENVHFLFVGNGARKNWVIEETKSKKLTNISFIDFLPRKEQQNFLNACDVGLVSLAPGMTGLGVPSKTYNILAAGKPVIAIVDAPSEIGLLIKEENIGWVVPPSNAEALAAAIREASQSKTLSEMGLRAREVAEKKYSLDAIVKKYNNVFSRYASK